MSCQNIYTFTPFHVIKGSSINDVMPEGGRGGVRVRMTRNVEGCIKKQDKGVGGKKCPKIA